MVLIEQYLSLFCRLVHNVSYYVLQALLDCSKEVARSCFQDMVFYETMKVEYLNSLSVITLVNCMLRTPWDRVLLCGMRKQPLKPKSLPCSGQSEKDKVRGSQEC